MKLLLIAAALLLAACGTVLPPQPETPAQSVYLAHGEFNAALILATKYKALPACEVPAPPILCSSTDVVTKVQQAANVAWTLIQAAETTVRDPQFAGSKTDQAVVSAQNAVGAFKALVNTLRTE